MPPEERIAASYPIDHLGARSPDAAREIETLVRAHYADVLNLTRSLLIEPADAEDAAQETFIAAALGLDSFRGDSLMKTWLFGIALNICRSQMRKEARLRKLQQAVRGLLKLQTRQRSPEEQAAQNETSERLKKAVQSLNEKHRLPVILFYIHDLPVPEIAALLETNTNTVYSRLHHARKQLKNLLLSM